MTRAVVFVNAAVLLILAAVGLSGARRIAPPPIPLELPSVVIPPEVALPVDPPTPEVIPVMSGDEIFSLFCRWTGKVRCMNDRDALYPWAEAFSEVCESKKECVLLASQAWVESRLERWVADGSCNSSEWRMRQVGWLRSSCDGGLATNPLQMHAGAWLELEGSTARQEDLLTPKKAARLAVKLLRSHPSAWTTWRIARAHAVYWENKI